MSSELAIEQQKRLNVGFYISESKELYEFFETKKEIIAENLNTSLEWRKATKAYRIITNFDGDINDKNSWNNLFDWLMETALKFKAVLQKLDNKI